jgi:hypothetical protein
MDLDLMVAREALALIDYYFLANRFLVFEKFELPPKFHRLSEA